MTTPPFGPAEESRPDALTDGAPVGGTAAGGDAADVTLDRLLDEIRNLQSSFDAKIRYDEVREHSVRSMSDELTAYRENQAQLQLRPLLIDLITLHDDLAKIGGSADCTADTAKVLGHFRDAVEQILARNGVEPFTVENDALDRARQRVISVLPSGDPSANRRIAERLRPGFQWHDRVLRSEWVSVYRYATPSPPIEPTVPPTPPAVPEADEGALR
ncbi:nucleotide exchange factor GrpE [Micromonospora sp. NPDC002296]|uniref:nucleotide exchange factor GrpE n=1 Tax=Micromonospora sp. NPDC002296 TaxID=3154271 RepID=UPI00331F6389